MRYNFQMQSVRLNWLAGVLLIPPLFIWIAIVLRSTNTLMGQQLATWLQANLSDIAVLIVWIGAPSAAMVFGLGGYIKGENKWASAGVVALSSLMLLMIFFAAFMQPTQ